MSAVSLASLGIRFSVYAPNGARLGELRDPVSWVVSRSHNGIPSLSISYPRMGANADLLESPCEIAVEWNDGAFWTEDLDSRFISLSSDRDEVDQTQTVTHSFVGYGWMLSKATVVLGDIDINPDNNKRVFKQKSVGYILNQLVAEARARGNLTGLTMGAHTTDSNGDPWLHDQVTISFDRGTDYLTILNSMAEQGLLDWRMQGRVLHIYNPGNAVAIPRVSRARIKNSTTIDPRTFLNQAASETVDFASGGGAWVGDDGARIRSDVLALASDGQPRFHDTLNYEHLSGVWDGQPSRELSIYRQLGQNPDDLQTRSFGSYIAEVTGKVRYAIVIPDAAQTNVMYTAMQLLQIMPNGIILQSGTTGTEWFTQAKSGLHTAITTLIGRGLPVIVLDRFAEAVKTSADAQVFGIVQNGQAAAKGAHTSATSQLITQGVGNTVFDDGDKFKFKDSRPAWMYGRRYLQSVDAQRKGSLWMRVILHDSTITTTARQLAAATAIRNAVQGSLPAGIAKAAPKKSVDPDVDRSDVGPVQIRYDRDLDAPLVRSIEDMAVRGYAYGDSFAKVEMENTGTSLPWGKWEIVVAQGGVDDPNTMEPLLLDALDKGALAKVEVSRRLALIDSQWLPYRDYDHGDIVLCQTADNDLRPYRIQQMILQQDPSSVGIVANLVMEDTFQSRDERVARSVMAANGTVGGSAKVGGAGVRPQPNSADNRVPAKPASVTVSVDRQVDMAGIDRPVLLASWDPVTEATNGAVAAISNYVLYLELDGGPRKELTRVAGDVTSAEIEVPTTAASATGVVSVAAVATNGREGEHYTTGQMSMTADTTPPPVPKAPGVGRILGSLMVSWDGTLSGPVPADFSHVEVHVGTSTNFAVGAGTYRDSLTRSRRSVVISGLPYDQMAYFRLVSVDMRGNKSAAGPSAGMEPNRVAAGDLGPKVVGPGQLADVVTGDIGTAKTTAQEAKTAADNATTTAGTAHDTAVQAAQDAATAAADAAAAQAVADAAQAAAEHADMVSAAASSAAAAAQTAAGNATSAAAAAQTTANGKNRTYYQSTAPTGTLVAGDLWFNTGDSNKAHVYVAGTGWTSARDATIAAAQTTADNAATAASGAQGTANTALANASTAQTTANNAATAAATAKTTADTAVSNAATAKSAADAAQSAADAAALDAAAAAGIASGKGKVWFQTAAPSGNANDLWIDTTGGANTPKRWSGSAWVAVTDKAATDAAAVAAAANTAAGNAASAASAAQSTANTAISNASTAQSAADAAALAAGAAHTAAQVAQNTANAKTTTFRQGTAPSSTGRVTGDLWYNTGDANKLSIWSGSAWVAPYSHTPDGAYDLASTASAVATTAQSVSGSALSAAQQAQSAAESAQSVAAAANNTATTAQGTAADAATTASAAQSTANAASSAASLAQTAADAAQTAASTAQLAANAAQTTADGKNRIYRQGTAPGAANEGDLWFNTSSGNALSVWTSGAWAKPYAYTSDQAFSAADAASTTAANAQTAANSAQGTANTALTNANAAQATANGKNKVTYSASTPSGSGATAGDLWFQSTAGVVVGQWQWSGSAWVAQSVSSQVIASLDVAKLTGGYIDAARLKALDIQALFLSAGRVNAGDILVSGSITAASGVIGSLDAGAISVGTLSADRIATGSLDANKLVANSITAGQLAANAVVAGKVAANAITAGTIAADAVTTGTIAANAVTAAKIASKTITADQIAANAITADSGIIASLDAGVISAGTLNVERLNANDLRARVLSAGKITASDMAAGTITATSGIIASIDAAKITTGTLSGIVIQGTTIRTAASGARVQFDSSGINQYNSSGSVVSSWTPAGLTVNSGTIQGTTYQSASTYPKMRISADGSAVAHRLRMYGHYATSDAIPDGEIYYDNGLNITANPYGTSASNIQMANGYTQIKGIGPYGDCTITVDSGPSFGIEMAVRAGQLGRISYTTSERIRWDSSGVGISPKLFIRDATNAFAIDMAIYRSGNTLYINNDNLNTLQMGTGSGRFQINGNDSFVWGSAGLYVYNQLFMRSPGGSESDGYLLRSGVNVELHADNGGAILSGGGGSTFQVTTPLGTPGVMSTTIYNRTSTGSANMIVIDAARGILCRTSSLRKDKLDRLLIPADYSILDMPTLTWVDRSTAEQHEGYSRRTAGTTVEDVQELVDANDGAFDALLIRDPESGDPEGVAYDRIVAYLIPVIRDMADRITALEARI